MILSLQQTKQVLRKREKPVVFLLGKNCSTRKYREAVHCAVTVKLVKQLNREAVAVKMKLLSMSQVLHQVVFNCVA